MNTMFVNDSSEKQFDDRSEMMDFVGERESKTIWLVEPADELKYVGLLDEPLFAPIRADEMGVSEDAILDTMSGSRLVLETSVGKKPVGISAIMSINDRVGWKADGYKKLSNYNPLKLAEALNLFVEASSGNVNIKISDEKVRAVHSSAYSFISTKSLLNAVFKYFDDKWPQFSFAHGYYSHEFFRVELDLSAYRDTFFSKLPLAASGTNLLATAEPAFIMSSSDIATSAVQLIPALALGGGTFVPLGTPIGVEHKGDDIEGRVAGKLDMLLAYFQERAENLQELENVRVVYARNALKRLLKESQIPKKCGLEAVEAFETMFGNEPATALDVYFAVVDAYSNVARTFAENKKKVFSAADCVVRASHARWSDYDLPGEVDY